MKIELSNMNLQVEQQRNIKLYYESEQVGDYYSDLIINNIVIVEMKAAENICEKHEAQLLNYLRATDIEVSLLLNFGKEPKFKRKYFTNDKKKKSVKISTIR